MPLLGDLREHVKSILASKDIAIGPDFDAIDDLEQWRTLLAEPAPWLSPADRFRNAALFTDVSRAIYEALTAIQIHASVQPARDWLVPLVKHWHETEATVITFNYDCLVELAYLDAMPGTGTFWPSDLYAIPITPAGARVGAAGRQKPQTFRLLKLHGSLDWWYSGPEAEQADLIYWQGWTGHYGDGMKLVWEEFGGAMLTDDKLPMLIPPVSTKSPFYQNRLLAAQWAKAAEALNTAEELVLMGYSAPVTDLTVTTLIGTQFKGNAIVPVNPDCKAFKRSQKLVRRTDPPEVVDRFICGDAIKIWTATCAS